jgi:hypothetical protein
VKTLLQAIAQIEGFGVSQANRPTRNNNPGNINMAGWLAEPPYYAVMEDQPGAGLPRFAKFPTADAGWLALRNLLLGPKYCNLTIEQAINRYAPPSENNTGGYVDFVCKAVGCQPGDIVKDVMNKENV